jgi:hypothetical protein
MAAPFVAGLVALMLQREPRLRAETAIPELSGMLVLATGNSMPKPYSLIDGIPSSAGVAKVEVKRL